MVMDEDRKIDDVEGSWAHTFSPLDLEAAGVRRTFSYLFGFLVCLYAAHLGVALRVFGVSCSPSVQWVYVADMQVV